MELVGEYFGPIIVITINFGVIPLLIDISSEFEGFRRKSSRQISIMRRIFIFMLLNTLIIPVTQTSTVLILFEELGSSEVWTWPDMLGTNLMAQQFFYIKFIIQLTFISNGFWLVDLVHRSVVCIKKGIHNYKHKHSVLKPPFRDDYEFDLGYH